MMLCLVFHISLSLSSLSSGKTTLQLVHHQSVMEKELRFADPKHDKVELEMFVRCSTHLQGSALRFECRLLETQLQDVSESFCFCPCLKDYRWVPLGF